MSVCLCVCGVWWGGVRGERERQTERQTEKETETQRQRQTERQRHRDRETKESVIERNGCIAHIKFMHTQL